MPSDFGPSELCLGLISSLASKAEDWSHWSIQDFAEYEIETADHQSFQLRRTSAWVDVEIISLSGSKRGQFRPDVPSSYVLMALVNGTLSTALQNTGHLSYQNTIGEKKSEPEPLSLQSIIENLKNNGKKKCLLLAINQCNYNENMRHQNLVRYY